MLAIDITVITQLALDFYNNVMPCLTARIATCLLPGMCGKYTVALVLFSRVTPTWSVRFRPVMLELTQCYVLWLRQITGNYEE